MVIGRVLVFLGKALVVDNLIEEKTNELKGSIKNDMHRVAPRILTSCVCKI